MMHLPSSIQTHHFHAQVGKASYGGFAPPAWRRCERAATPSSHLSTIPPFAHCRRKHLGTLPQAGTAFDLVQGAELKQRDEVELYPTQLATSITFGKKSHPECAAFSPDGQSLITGSVDGFLEVWDATTGQLRKDLQYQEAEEFMVHEQPVLCVAASRDGVALVSGALHLKLAIVLLAHLMAGGHSLRS